MNAINIIIAENEEASPWEPLSVRRGRGEGMTEPSGYARAKTRGI